jgi:tripartite-type tricarboxylate transporter receptor subunit TctC
MKKALAFVFSLFWFCFLCVFFSLQPGDGMAGSPPSAADFYKGKTVKMVIGFDSGNTVDTWARIIAPYLAKRLGATVVISNQGGGGGLVARNELSRTVKPDGLTIMMDPSGALMPPWLLNAEGVAYDITKFEYLGGLRDSEPGIAVSAKSPYTSVEKLQKAGKQIRFAVSGVSSLISIHALNAIEVLNLNAMVGAGYKNSAAYLLAMTQAEADAICSPLESVKRWEREGQAKVLLLTALERDKQFPDVPCFPEVAKLSDSAMSLLKALPANGKIVFAPPGTPKERVEFLKDSLTAVLAEKALQDDIIKMTKYWPGTISGDEMQKSVAGSGHAKDANIAYYKSLMSKYVK